VKALVTGGGGFLGGSIVRRLVERGWPVRTLQRGQYSRIDELGAEQVRGDIADPDTVSRAIDGVDVVFHVAAKVEPWGAYPPFHRTNVVGTENVLTAMRQHGVSRLVYTIWGPEDTNLVPQLVARYRAGQLRFVGDGSNLVDTAYIDNVVDAHMLAADRLEPEAACAGRPYFISNGEPWPMKKIINGILAAAGLPPEERSVPLRAALVAGAVFENLYKIFPTEGGPRMTRFVARNFATAHWFDISAARRDLGYEPRVSIEEGLSRLKVWFEGQE
jgi:nucleoside-diphosphate-sugar epimerase